MIHISERMPHSHPAGYPYHTISHDAFVAALIVLFVIVPIVIAIAIRVRKFHVFLLQTLLFIVLVSALTIVGEVTEEVLFGEYWTVVFERIAGGCGLVMVVLFIIGGILALDAPGRW